MKVTVTQEHINNGIPGNNCNCAVALAVKEKVGIHLNSVGLQYVTITEIKSKTIKCYVLSQKAKYFIENFDNKKPVKPITFEMRLGK